MRNRSNIPFVFGAILVVIALTAIAGSGRKEQRESLIHFETSADVATARARDEGKVIMIEFSAEWCGYCKEMKGEAFTDPEVAQLLNEVVPVSVDIDRPSENGHLIERFGPSSIPMLVFINPDGSEVGRMSGYDGLVPFKRKVERILGKS